MGNIPVTTKQVTHPAEQYAWDENPMHEIGTVGRVPWLAHWHMASAKDQRWDELAAIYHPDVK
ncbi:MAG: hypothetical protein QOJ56_4774 [Mycobacterium sp.]|jgi:hypothetical protein|nr:hypothetical protein [Mycobacterium sp.]